MGFKLPNSLGHFNFLHFKFPDPEEQSNFLSFGGRHLLIGIKRVPVAAGTDFLCGRGYTEESVKPWYKFLYWDGNCFAGLEHVGACLFIWQMSDSVTSSTALRVCEGFERAQCIVVGQMAMGSSPLPVFLL